MMVIGLYVSVADAAPYPVPRRSNGCMYPTGSSSRTADSVVGLGLHLGLNMKGWLYVAFVIDVYARHTWAGE